MQHKIIGYGHGESTVQPVRGDELVVTSQMQAGLEKARRELAISAALSAPGSLAGTTAGSYLGAVAAELAQRAREEQEPMPYLAHLDTERLKTAEQAAAVLDNLASYWDKDQKATISVLLARLRQELSSRKPVWNPETEMDRAS